MWPHAGIGCPERGCDLTRGIEEQFGHYLIKPDVSTSGLFQPYTFCDSGI